MSKVQVFILDSEYLRREKGAKLGDLNRQVAKIRIQTQLKLFYGVKTSGSKPFKSLPLCTLRAEKTPATTLDPAFTDQKCTTNKNHQNCHQRN